MKRNTEILLAAFVVAVVAVLGVPLAVGVGLLLGGIK